MAKSAPDPGIVAQSAAATNRILGMAEYYLWVRAWPWTGHEFAFERFDDFEDAAIEAALVDLADAWQREHPRRVSAARRARRPGITQAQLRQRASFEEIAPLARWTVRAGGFMYSGPRGPYWPTSRCYFMKLSSAAVADDVIAGLSRRCPRLSATGKGVMTLRYGKIASTSLEKVEAVDIARQLEDFEEGRKPKSLRDSLEDFRGGGATPGESWLDAVANEAAKIARIVGLDESPGPELRDAPPRPVAMESRPELSRQAVRALESYEFIMSRNPDLSEGGRRNYRGAYERLKSAVDCGDCTIYTTGDFPSLGTWSRHARAGLNHENAGGTSSRAGREHGSSIVDARDL